MSKEKFGFLNNHQILDAVGSTEESLHSIKVNKSKALVLKVDIKKAYDHVNWSMLHLVLLQIGFNLSMAN